MKIKKIRGLILIFTILITISIMITYQIISNSSNVVPKSATLVQNIPMSRYING